MNTRICKKVLFAMLALGAVSCTMSREPFALKAKERPFTNKEITKKVNDLYERMSQEERLEQLHGMYVSRLFGRDGHLDTARCRRLIPNGVGHFSQYASQENKSPEELRNMVAEVQEWIINNTPNGIPALFHEEVLSGIATTQATVYPQQIGLASSFNPELAAQKTRETAADLRAIGGALALSPMVDVCRNPYFNRLEESYGEDAYLSSAMGAAFVRGLQDGGLSKGVAATTKHFLGYGGGSESDTKELYEEILMPHEVIIRTAGSKVLMTGYHPFHDTSAVASAELQQGILRGYLGFDGVTVSDYGSISQITTTNDPVEKAALAFNAGNDVEFQNFEVYRYLPQAIERGLVTQERFEQAVKNVLTLKANLGLLDKNPNLYAKGEIVYDRPEERQTAYELATQSVVLLENSILPLAGEGKNIFLTGPNANSMWAMLGDYTYHGMAYFWRRFETDDMHPRIVNLRDGLASRLPAGFTLSYERGCDWTEAEETTISTIGDQRAHDWVSQRNSRRIDGREEIDRQKAVSMAAESDVIIAAMGENTMLCGENRDRGSLRLPGSQEQFVEELIATGKPVVLVMFGGRAQVIDDLADRCAAVIQAWYPGEEGGNALADIIFGNVSPSGKLSVSYPNMELDENICYNNSIEQDSRIQWPFGYGLSYTTFEYSNLSVDQSVKTSAGVINVSLDVTNTGDFAADEIVQLYVSPTSERSQHIKPIKLEGFTRVSLAPGQTKHIKFRMSPQQFGYYAAGHWNIDPGQFIVKAGASSQDIRLSEQIELKGRHVEMPLRTVYFSEAE